MRCLSPIFVTAFPIILDVDAEGRGEGQLMLGAEFSWNEDKNQVEITHFASEPIRLRNVRLR